MRKKGNLVVIEGIEGVGKSTQVELLTNYLKRTGINALMTREPGGSPYAESIRNVILNDQYAENANAMTMFLLFWAARSDHLHHVVVPAIESGIHVITDRFDGTTFSHQICGQECPELEELFFQMRQYVLKDVCPDIYIILDMEPEKSLARLAAHRGEPQNHFDRREISFHERVRSGCLAFAARFPSIIIDADRDVETVHEDIVSQLQTRNFLLAN